MDVPDHRRIGRQLKFFATDAQCGSGLPFWLSAGAVTRRELEAYVVDLERRHGYQHVNTPAMAKRGLYERSGHWQHFHQDMYPPMEAGSEQLVLRPMLCPHHILLYAEEPRTLQDLPLRLAEIGPMFRLERSGVVGGLSRVRQMTLNDGHVFCAPEHVQDEITDILAMVDEAYRALHIPAPRLRLSLAGRGAKYASDSRAWQQSEATIRAALVSVGVPYSEARGEAAFYGPKIDLQVTDPQGREETLSTIQVDFHLPGRFELRYRRGARAAAPVIVHRSIISTLERMLAHLLEVHDGALPVWLAPTQILVAPATATACEYARRITLRFQNAGLRAQIDDRDATLGARVRAAHQQRIPYIVIAGEREAESESVSVRVRGGHRADMSIEAFLDRVGKVVEERSAMLI